MRHDSYDPGCIYISGISLVSCIREVGLVRKRLAQFPVMAHGKGDRPCKSALTILCMLGGATREKSWHQSMASYLPTVSLKSVLVEKKNP